MSQVRATPQLRHPVRSPRSGLGVLGLAAAIVLVGLVGLLGSGSRPAVSPAPPTPTASIAPSPTAAVPSSAPSAPPIARYPDGIPTSFAGQPVLRGAAILAKARAMTTAEPFLVGAWLDVYTGPRSCPVDTRSLPPDSWLHACQPGVRASDQAGGEDSVLLAPPGTATPTVTFKFATGLQTGPAILRVHVHDPGAAQCGPDEATCDAMLVVESAVWSGDTATDPRPISIEAAKTAVEAAVPGTSLRLLSDRDMLSAIELRGGRTLQPPLDAHWGPAPDALVRSVSVLSSADAMRRALPNVTPGAAGALLQTSWASAGSGSDGKGHSYSYEEHWLVVENVAVLVLMLPTPSAADRALLTRLADALETAPATAGSPSPSPAVAQSCVPPPVAVPAYAGDPCPAALAAARRAVTSIPFAMERVSIVAGQACGPAFPVAGSSPVCFGAFTQPGRDMHGWVAFRGTDKVAAVVLWRPLVLADATAPPTPLPWTTEIIAFEVPPAGWTMP